MKRSQGEKKNCRPEARALRRDGSAMAHLFQQRTNVILLAPTSRGESGVGHGTSKSWVRPA